MPITLVTGPANAGKAHFVMEAVRSHVARAEAPLLVVPTEADQARYRRELAEGGPALGARVERFEGLLSEVVVRAGLAEAPLGALARERALARLAGARPGMARALASLVGELETQRVTPARLRAALGAWRASHGPAQAGVAGAGLAWAGGNAAGGNAAGGEEAVGEEAGGEKAGGAQATLERLCAVYESYHKALAKMRRADRELRVTRALDALRRRPSLWGSTPVLLYGFDDLTELQLDAIEALGGAVEARVTLALAYEPGRVVFAGRAGAFQRLAPLADSHTALHARAEYYAPRSREALHHLERSLLGDDPTRVEPGDAVRLLEGGSPRAELELVAGEVRASLEAGVPAGEIAIVHRSPDTIAGLIGEVLESFDIPYALSARGRFAHTAVGRGLLGLLRCAVAGGELDDLLAWLRTPGVLDRPELADRLEASARRRGAIDAERARALWEAAHWPLDRIDRIRHADAEGMVALADALIAEMQRLFCAPRRALAAVLEEDELDEARALAGARRALEELRELARAAPPLAPLSAELIDVLDGLELAGGERLQAGMVAVLDPLSLRARRVRMVFACGLQEGVFPAAPAPHPLLGEHDRRALAQASGLALRGEPDALAAERYLLYALASRPEERLTLSWHTADEDGTPLARSLFVDDVCDLFVDALREQAARRHAGAVGWPGPGRPAGAMATRDAARSGRHAAPAARDAMGARDAARAAPGAAPATAGARSRPIARLSDERVLGELRARSRWSASSLESWAGCPVKWFVERLLRPGAIDPDPEPLARGGLAHAALKDALEHLRERAGSAQLTPASADLAKRLLGEALVRQESRHPLSVAPERVPGARRRLQVDLERYVECAAEQASPLQPTHLELEFGFGGEHVESEAGPSPERDHEPAPSALPALDLGEGVLLRGRIDRVDVGARGEAVVYDYKGRAAPPGARWVDDGAFQVALYMRAVERLLGYTPVGGFYQPLAGRDIRARGAFDGEGGVELACVRTDRLDRSELCELVERCAAAARRAASEARSGALEPRPDTCAYGGGCAYPTICRCER